MRILGIDPGLDGGLVILNQNSEVLGRWVIPTIEAGKMKKAKRGKKAGEMVRSVSRSLDLVALRRVFHDAKPLCDHAILEQVASRPGMGAPAVFKFGQVYGTLEALLVAFKIPYTQVTPSKWARAIHAGTSPELDPKDRSRIALGRLLPDLDLRESDRSKKPHEGLMDAALLSLWGHRFMSGEDESDAG